MRPSSKVENAIFFWLKLIPNCLLHKGFSTKSWKPAARALKTEEAEQKEMSNLSLDEVEAKIIDYFDIYYNPDKNDIDVDLLAMAVKR